ncbi:MAG: aldehyde dehydrogenase family protein [Ilumatobacteraceae bacterium]|nr:aldehyde dehydrogenase family protein [Acidimicrobiales bacterium]MCB9393644.1 aldehyde dehydrogenase family protein [Acidimicrobiaceae bacterium]
MTSTIDQHRAGSGSPTGGAADAAAIAGIVAGARSAASSGRTRTREWRVATLRTVRELVVAHEGRILAALAADFGKPEFEAWATEIGFVLSDIDHTIAQLDRWMAPEKVPTPIAFQPGSSRIEREPLGVACVIAPWNYPVQLLLLPMVAAIAAGNAVVGKPSELAPATADTMAALVRELDDPAVALVLGGVDETTELLRQRFDHILYTGNGRVARIVMRAAAEHLTPVTLELGGKSPTIVTASADLDIAARRIAWGKFLNAGQTCIAPDYVLVERSVHDQLVERIAARIREFYGDDPKRSGDYARIVNDAHFARLERLLAGATVAVGGDRDAATRYVAPTVLTGVSVDDPVMADEIFGPILPVIAIDSLDEAIEVVNRRDKPLALYSFSADDTDHEALVARTSSGGVCINGTIMHVSNPHLPFGGVGPSGMGAYHGKAGFDTFSHRRAVHERSTRVDPSLLYPPYTAKKFALVKRGFTLPDPRDLVARARTALRRR